MEVFPQSCIPLASNLRLTGPYSENEKNPTSISTQEHLWCRLVEVLAQSVSLGESPIELGWDYDARSLFSPRLKDRNGKRIDYMRSHDRRVLALLKYDTYWYKRLPKSGKNKVKKLVQSKQGRSTLKEIINTCDGVLVSLLLSVPESFGSYSYTDRMISSIMMNCFHSYSKFQKGLKEVRKQVKYQHMTGKKITLRDDLNRTFSFVSPLISILNKSKERRSKSIIFRLACFVQTRATGLADKRMSEASIESFLETVTVKREFLPDDTLKESIRMVQDLVLGQTDLGQNPEFRISASSSACYENSRRKGGKFEYLSRIVRKSGMEIPDLAEGRPGALGNLAYQTAKQLAERKDESVRCVNVAAVRENGKARVVTSGSFWKESALQPYSHLTIHLLKTIKNIRNGLRAAKLGWKAIESLHYLENDTEFLYQWMEKVFVYSTDWEKATDKPTPQMAGQVVLPILRGMGVPDEDIRMIEFYWLSPKELFRRGKHIGTLVCGVPMGDPLTKTCLSLAHPICDLYARLKTHEKGIEEGNGDDTIAFSTSTMYFEEHARAAKMLGYDTSELDTFVTEDWGTYCEEWIHRPMHKSNTVKTAMKVGNLDLLPYLDVPKIRTVIATAKDRQDFSSDVSGKITLVGKESEYTRKLKKSPYRVINSVVSSIQDTILATVHQSLPYHLPRQVYGLGKPAPDWNVYTWLSAIKAGPEWKIPVYYHTFKVFNLGRSDVLPRGYLKESKHFNQEPWVEVMEINDDDPIKEHRVLSKEQCKLFNGTALDKLKKMGFLISERKIMKYYLFQERLDSMKRIERDLFQRVLSQVDMIDYEEITEDDLRREITVFCDRYADRPFDLRRDQLDDLYDHNVVEFLERGNPLQVTSVHFPFLDRFVRRLKPMSRYEEEGRELYEWFVGAREQVLNDIEPDYPPPHLLDDDPLIIRQIALMETSHYIIATDDQALLRKAESKVPGVVIIQISCRDLFSMTDDEYSNIEEVLEQISSCYGETLEDITFLVDTGSVEAFTELRTSSKTYTNEVQGIPWTKSVKRSNFKIKPMKVGEGALNRTKLLTPLQLGYPQRGFSYRRRRR
ncbi:RNA-dependent RNA polymerase [Aspergillus creber narnavirus 1]|nr:RNA-dependent RNA polymerase [Aspergillus creber narnavirus 1]